MSTFFIQPVKDQIRELEIFSREILSNYDINVTTIESINYEYNATMKITTLGGNQFALRININSPRTRDNLLAEVSWVNFLFVNSKVKVAEPIKSRQGDLFVSVFHPETQKNLHCVLFKWLAGSELEDEPQFAQIYALGQTMGKMHLAAKDFQLPPSATLPILDDVMWWTEDYLLSSKSVLDDESKSLIARALEIIDAHVKSLYLTRQPILIHADMHGGNVLWMDGELSVIDFDDSAIGLPSQDLATAIYYLDTPEQDAALREGYASVAPLPEMTDRDLEVFLIQRRIILLNYLYETVNAEHRELLPTYLVETLRRVKVFLKIA